MVQQRSFIITVSSAEYDVTLMKTVEEMINDVFYLTRLSLVDISSTNSDLFAGVDFWKCQLCGFLNPQRAKICQNCAAEVD